MLQYYGSIYMAMWTLFQTTSGGVDWRRCAICLLDIHWSYAVWFGLFVAFVVFALLNIVTGIFVNSAIQCAQEDQDVAISEAMEQENSYAQSLMRIFMEADADKNGMVDADEFDMHLEDRHTFTILVCTWMKLEACFGFWTSVAQEKLTGKNSFLVVCA
jgi:hypothetical protein